jgi:hypothetical protein
MFHALSYCFALLTKTQYFLLDDSHSMSPHWPGVRRLAGLLMYFLKKKDDDGVDVYLANDLAQSGENCRVKKTVDLENFLERSRPLIQVSDRKTNMYSALSAIIGANGSYRKSLSASHKRMKLRGPSTTPPKKAILFIFTDGKWRPDPDEHIKGLIKDMVHAMKDFDKDQFGIQFIQYGDDPAGTKWLTALDDDISDDNWP